MPNITQLPVIEVAGNQTYFLVVDNKLARRFSIDMLSQQLSNSKVVNVPTSTTSLGNVGEMAFDTNYIYICVAANTWRRMSASTF
jgi:hypothetical protein